MYHFPASDIPQITRYSYLNTGVAKNMYMYMCIPFNDETQK